jgi:hypothetical protein
MIAPHVPRPFASTLFAIGLVLASTALAEEVDLGVVNRIKNEAFHRSQVMEYLHHLADENGPRLAASPGYRRAAQWAVEAFHGMGIAEARLEPWGRFGRSWSYTRVAVQMVEPMATTLVGVPLAWSGATRGAVEARVVFAPLWSEADDPDASDLVVLAERIAAYRTQHAGRLRSRIVLLSPLRPFTLPFEPDVQRWSDADLEEMTKAREPVLDDLWEWPRLRMPVDPDELARYVEYVPEEIQYDHSQRRMRLMDRLIEFLNAEGVAAVLMTSGEGNGGVVFAEDFGSFESGAPEPPPSVKLMSEHYNRLVRLVERGTPVVVRVEVDATFPEREAEGMNVIAELPGKSKPGEVVMMGAHLDSWHGGTGATDNATGCAVVMEALRILRALDVELDRTVRVGLWDAEEQGHLGSRAYVRRHLGDPRTMALEPAHADFSVYFNIDTGTGRTRGVLTQGNDAAKPFFTAMIEPFVEHGVTTLVPRNDWGTDHMAFDAVGLPSFDLLQDQLDYWSHTHHSNVDTVDHVVPGDLMTSAAFLASLVYHAATRDELLPREALPPPLPAPKALPEILREK